jgi:hypothetical protein
MKGHCARGDRRNAVGKSLYNIPMPKFHQRETESLYVQEF